MANTFCKEDLIQYKLRGQKKPYIDQNLQIHIPELENIERTHDTPSLYSYYSIRNSLSTLPIDKQEIEKAMSEAQHSYEAWKKLQEKIKDTIHNQSCS